MEERRFLFAWILLMHSITSQASGVITQPRTTNSWPRGRKATRRDARENELIPLHCAAQLYPTSNLLYSCDTGHYATNYQELHRCCCLAVASNTTRLGTDGDHKLAQRGYIINLLHGNPSRQRMNIGNCWVCSAVQETSVARSNSSTEGNIFHL